MELVFIAVFICLAVWFGAIHQAVKLGETKEKLDAAEKTNEVKDAQLEVASKPNLSRTAILAKLRAEKL